MQTGKRVQSKFYTQEALMQSSTFMMLQLWKKGAQFQVGTLSTKAIYNRKGIAAQLVTFYLFLHNRLWQVLAWEEIFVYGTATPTNSKRSWEATTKESTLWIGVSGAPWTSAFSQQAWTTRLSSGTLMWRIKSLCSGGTTIH